MLNPKTIKKYLNRKLNTYDWIKRYGVKSLNLWNHQKALFLLMNELKRFLLLIDMGGGKTLSVLSFIRYRKQCGDKVKAVVFVPYITSVDTWIEQCTKHTPDLKLVPLLGTTAENLTRLQSQGDLFVICYASAVAMVSDKDNDKWTFKASEIREYFAGFNMLVMDEVHKCKRPSTLTFRMCRAISAQCEWVFGLTGTPFGKEPKDLWAQFYLIDFGETLGPTLGLFMEAFYTSNRAFFNSKIFEFKFKQKLMPVLHKMIKNRSLHYGIDELTDMPEKSHLPQTMPPPADGVGYIENALWALKLGAKARNYNIIESSYLQLRQLASGFMTLRGEDNDRIHLKFEDNPKLEALAALVEGMAHGCKMVVFHHFIYTNKMISEKLKEMKVKHARVWGGQRDPIGQIHKFKEDPECRVLVINIKSGSSSLNLQMANYVVFFEQPDSPTDRIQAEARCWRPGQTQRVFFYDLLCRNTMDVGIRRANIAGETLLKHLLQGNDYSLWVREEKFQRWIDKEYGI